MNYYPILFCIPNCKLSEERVMETIRRIIGAARGGLLRHIQPGRLLRAAMPEVFPVTAAAALLAAYGMPAGMGSLFGAGGSYALPVLGIAFLCARWCAGMNIYPAFAGTGSGQSRSAGVRKAPAAAKNAYPALHIFAKEKEKRLPGRNEIFIHGGGADGALPGFRNADDTGRGGVFRGRMRFRCGGRF